MAGYYGSKAEGESSQGGKQDEATVEGTVCMTFSGHGKSDEGAQRDYLEAVDRLGYKIGLRLRTDQSVRSFAFRSDRGDIAMAEDAVVTADLQRVFPAPPGERWVGFVPRTPERRRYTFPEAIVVCYEFVLVLAPPPPLPVLVPMVIRFNNGQSFAVSCVATVLVVRATGK